MVIRDARPEEIVEVMDLCRSALAASTYRNLPEDTPSAQRVLMYCIGSPSQFCQVIEMDGKLEGILVGNVEKVWHSTKKQASDLVFYTTEKGKGGGALLARRFLRWARSRPGVELIGMSVSYGGPNIKRTGKMLEKLGLTYVGGIYLEVLK
jgi:hypothetical protein